MKVHPNKHCYIIEAEYSSSGGCYGSEVHKKDRLCNLLKINPIKYIDSWNMGGSWDFWICLTEDLDSHFYSFNEDNNKWEKSRRDSFYESPIQT